MRFPAFFNFKNLIMQKLLLTIALCSSCFFLFAQEIETPRISGDTLIYKPGLLFIKGERIKMGTGAMPDGDFKFVRRSATSLFQYNSTTGYQGLANSANSLPRTASGLEYKIVRIDKRGSKKNGYVYYPIINVGAIRFEIDVENAIKVGEIVVPDAYKPVLNSTQQVSIPDQLKKLKELYDSGGLTKEEYEAAKKKLLDKM
jgi:hypothetical protein